MPKSTKPRKRYRPTSRSTLPPCFRYSTRDGTWLQLIPHSDLESMRDGTGTGQKIENLRVRTAWAVASATLFFMEQEAVEACKEALSAVDDIADRFKRLQRVGCTGPEFASISRALTLMDEMQANLTRRQQAESLQWARDHLALEIRAQPL